MRSDLFLREPHQRSVKDNLDDTSSLLELPLCYPPLSLPKATVLTYLSPAPQSSPRVATPGLVTVALAGKMVPSTSARFRLNFNSISPQSHPQFQLDFHLDFASIFLDSSISARFHLDFASIFLDSSISARFHLDFTSKSPRNQPRNRLR